MGIFEDLLFKNNYDGLYFAKVLDNLLFLDALNGKASSVGIDHLRKFCNNDIALMNIIRTLHNYSIIKISETGEYSIDRESPTGKALLDFKRGYIQQNIDMVSDKWREEMK